MTKTSKTEKGFMAGLISLIIPMTLQNFMFALIPVSDTMMLVALDQDAMSSVSLAAQMSFIMSLFVSALVSGLCIFVAQYWGKKDIAGISRSFGYVIRITLPVLISLWAMAFFLPMGVMAIFSDSPSIINHGINYLRIASFSYIFSGVAQLYGGILKNIGYVKQCTVIGIAMVLMNIGFNAIFIFGLLGLPRMQEAGAALGTTLSCLIAMVAYMVLFVRSGVVKIGVRDIFHTEPEFRKDFSKYATPTLANSMLWGFGFAMITVIMGHLGPDATAANAIVAVAKDLVSCFCFALAYGGAIIVGNELGAGNLERARQYGDRLCHLAIGSGIIAGVLLAASTPIVVHLVDLSPQASHYLTWMLILCVYYLMGRSINSTVISGIFTAGGDTKFGFICDTITMWAFIVPVGALAAFVFKWPVMVVYFLLNLDEMIKLPAVYWYYKKYNWVKNIVDKD
ncbi:MAG: MATE family efflux transporter [Saccharofermentans sp.]|nr:MATE family efflux transporter [Saccharofermentans sp.]